MRYTTLSDLPAPPPGRMGWPWTEDGEALPRALPDGSSWPRITIVTPSFNQGQFLEETIRSVLLQGYPDLEYIVIDGGSTDGSVEIIKKYERWLAYWISESDRGQSHAINKGWAKATGDLIAYLNSDDIYLPGAFRCVARAWARNKQAVAIVGAVQSTDASSQSIGRPTIPRLPEPCPLDLTIVDQEKWHLPQSPGFWTQPGLSAIGKFVREDLHYTMDRELYYRTCRAGSVVLLEDLLATFRHHDASKTGCQTQRAFRESAQLILSFGTDGGHCGRRRRQVARWRVSQGNRTLANLASEPSRKLFHLFLAALYRPSYLMQRRFYRTFLEAAGLSKPASWCWFKIIKPLIRGSAPTP